MKVIRKASEPKWVGMTLICSKCQCKIELENKDKEKMRIKIWTSSVRNDAFYFADRGNELPPEPETVRNISAILSCPECGEEIVLYSCKYEIQSLKLKPTDLCFSDFFSREEVTTFEKEL